MEHNRKQLWKKNDVRRPLRVPNILLAQSENRPTDVNTSTNSQENGKRDFKSIEELVANSSLNSDAAEFIPSRNKSYGSSVKSSIQNRLKLHKTGSNCRVAEQVGHNVDYSNRIRLDTERDIKRIRQIIRTLSHDPGQFDNLLPIFMDTVIPYLEDLILLSEIVKIVVNGALEIANFRYSGAKLCFYIEQNCPSFRAELHLQCRKKLEQGANLENVILFIGELYVQLPHVNIYGALLVEAFEICFTEGSNESIMSICTALKLTGFFLESSNKADLDNTMKILEAIKHTKNGRILNFINKICDLRSSNWGMPETELAAQANRSRESNYEYGVPDYAFFQEKLLNRSYVNEDTQLTQDEEEFLTANVVSNEELYSHPDSEGEMDDEAEEAYEEFLKLSLNN